MGREGCIDGQKVEESGRYIEDEWMDVRVYFWMYGCMDAWMNGRVDELMNRRKKLFDPLIMDDECMDEECMDLNGWMDDAMDELMDGQMEQSITK